MLGGIDKWIYGFLGLGVFAAIGAIVISSVRDTQTSGTVAYSAANNSLTGVSNLTAQFGTAGTLAGLGVLALAAVVIMMYFRGGRGGE